MRRVVPDAAAVVREEDRSFFNSMISKFRDGEAINDFHDLISPAENADLQGNIRSLEEKTALMKKVLKRHRIALDILGNPGEIADYAIVPNEAERLTNIINLSGREAKNQWFDFFERSLGEEFRRVDDEEQFYIRLALIQGVTFMQQDSFDLDSVAEGIEGGQVPLVHPQLVQAVAAFENKFQNQQH